MPSRVVRGEINSSDSLSRVSMLADLTFRAMIVAADDYGRLDGRLPMLRAALFPTRDEVTERKLSRWIDELAQEGCVQLYTVEGRPFVQLTGWEKHRGTAKRAIRSRFPDPPQSSGDLPESPGDPSEGRGTRDENRGARVETPPQSGAPTPADRKEARKRPEKTPAPERLTDAERAEARARFPEVSARELGRLECAYLLHGRARGTLLADWGAGFEKWVLDELTKFGRQRAPDTARKAPPQFKPNVEPEAQTELARRREEHRLALLEARR